MTPHSRPGGLVAPTFLENRHRLGSEQPSLESEANP